MHLADRWREWNERTHGTGFELRRHFFRRFFDSDLVTAPGQWRVVAAGAVAILASLTLIVTQSYYSKYLALLQLDSGDTFRQAMVADHLFFITMSMLLTGLFTALQWSALFPGLRDYLALAGLPIKPREIFTAKAAALIVFAGALIAAVNLLPSFMLPAVSLGRYQRDAFLSAITLFASASMAGFFLFFVLVALQGVLLNAMPARWLAGTSLFVQGLLLIGFLCAIPLALSIPGLYWAMDGRPGFAIWLPPVWFLAIDQRWLGNHEEYVRRLAGIGTLGLAGSAAAAAGVYLWSYRHHRVSLLESSVDPPRPAWNRMRAWALDWSIRRPEEQAVFAFMTKTLTRSSHHRLVLTAYAGIGVAIVTTTFAWLALAPTFRGFDVITFKLQQAALSVPLALSLFLLTGFRYLFRLPVELRANWVFRVNEGGNRRRFLEAVERFLTWFAVIPVAAVTFPLEIALLGWIDGAVGAVLATMTALILEEFVLFEFQKIPFTCSYLPGRRNLVETVMLYGAGVAAYIVVLSLALAACLPEPSLALMLFGLLLAGWAYLRRVRAEAAEMGALEFEEEMEPAIHTLSIDADW